MSGPDPIRLTIWLALVGFSALIYVTLALALHIVMALIG
jgi:hypothetical protein